MSEQAAWQVAVAGYSETIYTRRDLAEQHRQRILDHAGDHGLPADRETAERIVTVMKLTVYDELRWVEPAPVESATGPLQKWEAELLDGTQFDL